MITGFTHTRPPQSRCAGVSPLFTTFAIMQLVIVLSTNNITLCLAFTDFRKTLCTIALHHLPVGMTNQTLRNLKFVVKSWNRKKPEKCCVTSQTPKTVRPLCKTYRVTPAQRDWGGGRWVRAVIIIKRLYGTSWKLQSLYTYHES